LSVATSSPATETLVSPSRMKKKATPPVPSPTIVARRDATLGEIGGEAHEV